MKTLMKCAITFALVLSVLAAAAASASASRGLRLQSGTALTVTASGLTTFTFSGIRMICTVNLTLSLNASIAKAAGTGAGAFTAGTLSGCNDGSTGVITNAPIPILYTSFTGSLPSNITSLLGRTGSFMYTMSGGVLFPPPPGGCAYTASSLTLSFPVGSSAITTFRFTGAVTAPAGCPTPVTLASSNFTFTAALRSVQVALV